MAEAHQKKLDDDLALKKNFILTETARSLVSQSKFYEAIPLLEESMDGIQEATMSVKLLEFECYVQLGREIKASRIIEDITKVLRADPTPSINIVETSADAYSGIATCVRTMLMRKLAFEMYVSSDLTAEKKFAGVFKTLHSSSQVVRMVIGETIQSKVSNLVESALFGGKDISSKSDSSDSGKLVEKSESSIRLFTIAIDYGVGYMLEMYKYLEQLRGVETRKRARDLASCANCIGFLYCLGDQPQKSIRWRKGGMAVLEEEFGGSASDYNLYGDLHHNVGVCLYTMHKFAEAEQYYLKAIEIYYEATDYATSEMREKDLSQSRSDLRDTRQHLNT